MVFELNKDKNLRRQKINASRLRGDELEKELKNIYKTEDKMPNLTKLDHKKRSRFKKILIIIVALLAMLSASILGFIAFQPKQNFTDDKINLEIKAPFNAYSGERIKYEINIANGGNINLAKVKLTVNLPENFIFENTNFTSKLEQTNDDASQNIKTYNLEDLFSQSNQSITITGKLIGEINSKQTVSATLSYYPANFNSEFQKNNSFDTLINGSLSNFELEYPTQAADSETANFVLKINDSSQDTEISDLQAELDYPQEFTLSQSQIIEPNKTGAVITEKSSDKSLQKTWDIAKILPEENWQIKFSGKFNVSESKSLDFSLKLKIKNSQGNFIGQKEQKLSIQIIKGDLMASLIVNGSSQDKAVNVGGAMSYLLVLENKSKKTMGDIKVKLLADSPFLDWDNLDDKNKGTAQDGQILWTKTQIPQLALLLPEAEVEIPVTLNLKNFEANKKYKEEDLKIKNYFEAQINKIDNTDSQVVVKSNTIANQLNTDFNLQAQLRYFADDNSTIGTGPLPPIVGQKTSYKLFIKLTNSLHEISNIAVHVKLPSYVSFNENNKSLSTGNASQAEQNTILWQISSVPITVNEVSAEFEISITPSSTNINKILNLVSEITAEATDISTQDTISKSVSGLTTNLDSDSLGKNKGLIQAQ